MATHRPPTTCRRSCSRPSTADRTPLSLQLSGPAGATLDRQVFAATKIDPWFIRQFDSSMRRACRRSAERETPPAPAQEGPSSPGLSDRRSPLRRLGDEGEDHPRLRWPLGSARSQDRRHLRRRVRRQDAVPLQQLRAGPAAETEVAPQTARPVIILGSGPNRIGQGIEFDYTCVHAATTLRPDWQVSMTVMVNCNPETVSTDYTCPTACTSSRSPSRTCSRSTRPKEDGPGQGVIVQLGGQTPLSLAARLKAAGVPIRHHAPNPSILAETVSSSARSAEEGRT